MQLAVPTNAQRLANFNAYMPASTNHPNATEAFRHAAVPGHPEFADLGLWNIYLNPGCAQSAGESGELRVRGGQGLLGRSGAGVDDCAVQDAGAARSGGLGSVFP